MQIEYNGKLYDVEIVDTAGQEEFSSFRDSSVATGDAFLVLFAINSALSWHELKELRSKIIQDRQPTSTRTSKNNRFNKQNNNLFAIFVLLRCENA